MSERDWCARGNSVRTLAGDVVKIFNVTQDNGVYCDNYNNYCRTELTPLDNGLNGYRWDVIYNTGGSKPDLPDDVEVATCNFTTQSVRETNWIMSTNFKITDERFVPADRKSNNSTVKESLVDDWYDYTNQKALRLPPVGEKCQVKVDKLFSDCTVIHHASNHLSVIAAFKSPQIKDSDVGHLGWSDNFRPLDWNRKAEAERKRVVDAAYQAIGASGTTSYAALDAAYAAGFLRMPEDK